MQVVYFRTPINKELQELNDDAVELYKVTDFESTSKIKDVRGWYALQQSEKCTIEEGRTYGC